MEVARNFILPFITEGKHAEADYKTRLQEIVQQNPEERLSYVVEQESGPDHDKHFVVAVDVYKRQRRKTYLACWASARPRRGQRSALQPPR